MVRRQQALRSLVGVPIPSPPLPRIQSAALPLRGSVRSVSLPPPSLCVIPGLGCVTYNSFSGGSLPWFSSPCGHDRSASVPLLMMRELWEVELFTQGNFINREIALMMNECPHAAVLSLPLSPCLSLSLTHILSPFWSKLWTHGFSLLSWSTH